VAVVAELADLEPDDRALPDTEDTRLAASGPRAAAMAGAIAPMRRPAARLRAHRLDGAAVAVLIGWAVAGAATALGWL
jgi:hypothetical protein